MCPFSLHGAFINSQMHHHTDLTVLNYGLIELCIDYSKIYKESNAFCAHGVCYHAVVNHRTYKRVQNLKMLLIL